MPLTTNVAAGQTGHAALHNEERTAINLAMTRAAGQTVFVGPGDFSILSGTPDNNTVGAGISAPIWNFDPATTEIITATLQLPTAWTQYVAYLWWTTKTANTGNVYWNYRHFTHVAGDISTAGEVLSSSTAATMAAPGVIAKIVRTSMGSFNISGLANLPIHTISVRRIGADASDTFPDDASLLGVQLVPSAWA